MVRAASAFIGRGAEVAHLVELVSSAPLVTVTGAGGVGKTRLAREAAALVAHEMTESVRFADLAALPVDAGVDAVSSQVGFASPDAAAASLGEQSVLLVLDNCEHVLDGAREFVAGVLDGGREVRIVTTSRTPLGLDGERVLVLAPLGLPGPEQDPDDAPAVQLFLDRAASSGAAVDTSPSSLAEVATLCRRLDGLPLAIELAAARARTATPAELLADVDRRLDVLRRTGAAPASARHESMRTAIDASVELLDPEDRVALRRLSVFAGPFTADAAHRVVAGDAGGDRLSTLDQLARLVDRSLLVAEQVAGTTRYRMLELLREHAGDHLAATGEAAEARERFVAAVIAEAERVIAAALEGWSGDLVAAIELHFHDFVAAIESCVAHDATPDRVHLLVVPMFASVHQSRSLDVLRTGSRLLERWPDASAPWRPEALAVLATAAVISGDVARARALAAESLDRAGTTPIASFVAERALGLAARAVGDLPAARAHFGRGRQAAEALGAASFARELRGFDASVRDLDGDTLGALDDLDGLIAEAVAARDAINETWARLVRSTALMRAGRWEDAEAELGRATSAAEGLGYPWWEGAQLRQLAVLAATRGSLAAAKDGWKASTSLWLRAVEQAAARGSVGEVALTMRAAAVVASRAGEAATAEALLAAAPQSGELTVLPALFPEHLPPPADDPARRVTLPSSLRAARAILGAAPVPPAGLHTTPNVLRREGDTWTLTFRERTVRVRHLKGLGDLAVLLARPGVEVHCLELIGGTPTDGDLGPAVDETARRAYEQRIRALQLDIDDAREANDLRRAELAELELDALVGQLAGAYGLGGRARPAGSSSERARTAVAYRLRAAVRRVADHHEELGRHLRNAVRTGTWCAYLPESEESWAVSR